jgi:hypothetical protein
MSTLVITPRTTSILNDSGLSGAFSPAIASVKIIDRFPKAGNPQNGIPLAVDVEVNVDRSLGSYAQKWFQSIYKFRLAVECPNVVIGLATIGGGKPTVYSIAEVETDFSNSCIGVARLRFPENYRPEKRDVFHVVVYDEGTTIEEIQSGKKPMYTSKGFKPYLSLEDGKASGIYDSKTEGVGIKAASLNIFSGLEVGAQKVVKYGGAGLILYFLWANKDLINASVKKLV